MHCSIRNKESIYCSVPASVQGVHSKVQSLYGVSAIPGSQTKWVNFKSASSAIKECLLYYGFPWTVIAGKPWMQGHTIVQEADTLKNKKEAILY